MMTRSRKNAVGERSSDKLASLGVRPGDLARRQIVSDRAKRAEGGTFDARPGE
jgi:hypothetical protein